MTAHARVVASALILCAAFAGGAAPRGQAPDPRQVACPSTAATLDDLLIDSRKLLEAQQSAEAAACFDLAVQRAARGEAPGREGPARLGLGQALYNLADYPRAEREADRALELYEAAGDPLNAARATRLKGSIRMFRGDRAGAQQLHRAAAEQFEKLGAHRDRAIALLGLSNGTENRDERGALLDETVALARKAQDFKTEGRALHSRGDNHFAAGRFDQAIADLGAAIERFDAVNDRTALGDAWVSLGRIHRAHGRLAQAIEYYDRAIAIQEMSGDLRGLVQSVNAKAVALGLLGRRAEARREYERACEIARRTGSARIINFAEGNLAGAYADEGDYAKAIALLEDVLTREQEPYILAYRHSTLSESYAALGRFDRALEHAGRATAFARDSQNHDYLPTVLHRQALVERRAGRPDEALAHARDGVVAVEDLRTRLVPSDYMKRGFADMYQSLFGLTIALMLDGDRDADALVTAEQARARAFLDLLAGRDLIRERPSDDPPAAPAGHGDLPLASYATAAPVTAPEITAFAARLRSVLVSYWVARDEVFIWVASSSGDVRAARVAVARENLEKTVAAAIPSLGGSDGAALSRLHDWLIRPVARWLPPGAAMTIVPHGPLFRVAFAALPDAGGVYLVERHPISYAPSISSFRWTSRLAERATRARTHLLVADPRPMPRADDDTALPPLAAATREVRAIQKILGAAGTVSLSAARASEAAVRRELAGKRVIHLATHAVIRDDAPFESFLALGASGAEPASDGRLTVRELYDLSLDAGLVVMSACRSATGRISGDGISGLSRALFYAGAPRVVATLWDVADEPSARILADFYRASQAGADTRAALRQAQLRMIEALRAGQAVVRTPGGEVHLSNQPFYWASWIVLGEP